VLKVVADGLYHKTRAGGVRLGVAPDDVMSAFHELERGFDGEEGELQGILIEEMAPEGLELALGALWDSSFGHVVMVGQGGTDVEDKAQVAFRLSPVTAIDVEAMLHDVGITNGAHGGHLDAQQRRAVVDAVLVLAGEGGLLEREAIVELDLNPVIVNQFGLVFVDAHAVFDDDGLDPARRTIEPALIKSQLDPTFTPTSVVVIGASPNPEKMGYRAVRNLLDFGYAGEVYGVHPSGASIEGVQMVTDVGDLPYGIDRAAIIVPAPVVPEVIQKCADAGVKTAQIYSAGFGEYANDGRQLETKILSTVRDSQLRVLGPNCIGTYCSSGRITMISAEFCSANPGPIGFVSQSGTYAGDVVRHGKEWGYGLSKVVSAGNCLDVDMAEYIAYFQADPDTELVGLYVETLTDARAFFLACRNMTKPILALKGGRSERGARAATSHTGALAGDWEVWRGAAAQSGVLLKDDIEDLFDAFLAYDTLGTDWLARPGRTAIFGSGGGVAVVATDRLSRLGMDLAELHTDTVDALSSFGVPGTSITNPVDVPIWSLVDGSGPVVGRVTDVLAGDADVGICLLYLDLGTVFDFMSDMDGTDFMEQLLTSLLNSETVVDGRVPVVLVLRPGAHELQDALVRQWRRAGARHGVPVFDSMRRAIWALASLRDIHVLQVGR
jgi:acyl-CoA synthetase (NDP forming)